MKNIWDFWAKHYDKLWVQPYSLKPTRDSIIKGIGEILARDYTEKGQPIYHLDVGCGIGQLIEDIKSTFGPEVVTSTGLDFSNAMVEIARKKNPMDRFLQGDAHELDFPDKAFDLVTCCHSLPYYQDQQRALKEFYRVLKPGGYLLLANASINNSYDRLIMALVKLTTGPANYPSREGILELLEPIGYKLVSQEGVSTSWFVPNLIITTARRESFDEGITC